MKLGCAAWSWYAENQPYEWTIPEIARLGFQACGLQSDRDGPWSIYDYFTPAKARELRRLAADHGLAISELVMWGRDLNHSEAAARRKNIEEIQRAVDLAGELGTDLVNTTLPWPWRSRYTAIVKKRSNLPLDYSWADDWRRYVDSIAACVDYAAAAGRKIMLEAFAGTVCCTPDAVLRLFEQVGSPNLGYNLDTAHLAAQNHDPALAVYKLGRRIFHSHIKDSEGLPAGMGSIDFEEVIRALRAVGFDGVLSIEAEGFDHTSRYSRAARDHILAILEGRW